MISGLVVTGKFDGRSPSIACATTGGKIMIHSPHEVTNSDGQLNAIRYLNLNREITALGTGSLSKGENPNQPDLIYVGSASNLLAYDVDRNADAFFVDVQDGVNSLVLGKLGTSPKPLVITGGNCSVLGFDSKGTEAFWTVTGDNVSALALCDVNASGAPLLLVGSEDFEIRVFRHEELMKEITEADKVSILTAVGPSAKFAYGLANGTVGVYSNMDNRQWRVKTKNKVTAMLAYDIDMDGVPEIFSGWSNGSFAVRREENGEVLFRQTMDAAVAGIINADYRLDGKEEVMICSEAGEVRAFLATDMELSAIAESGASKDQSADQKALALLQQQKLELLAEMKVLERTVKLARTSELPVGALPPGTQLSYKLEGDLALGAVTLTVEVSSDVQIVNLVAVDLEGVVLVDKEILAIATRPQSKVAVLPLRPAKISPCTLRIQTHVATRSLGSLLHVFESSVSLPRFAAFKYIDRDLAQYPMPTSKVSFTLRDSFDRLLSWVQENFLVPRLVKDSTGAMKLVFVPVCDQGGCKAGSPLIMQMRNASEGGTSFMRVQLHCASMDLAAELVQDLVRYFTVQELESEATFPDEMAQFEDVLRTVADCQAARINLAADMADDSQRIKALIIRAEDCRLMNDMEAMRKAYTELNALNGQLIGGYSVRAQNQASLLAALKLVNQMIQKAANLRAGKSKARVIADCRTAVKGNNMKALFRIVQQGYDSSIASSQPK